MSKLFQLIISLVCVGGLDYQANAELLKLLNGQTDSPAPYYLGSFTDGIPSGLSDEAGYINYLATLGAGAGNTQIPVGTGEIYNRQGSSLVGPFLTALSADGIKDEEDKDPLTPPVFDNIIDVISFSYVLGKYDAGSAGSLVWFVDGIAGEVELPPTYNGHELSHISLFYGEGGPGTGVPDGGTTVALLGIGLIGLCALSSRKKSS